MPGPAGVRDDESPSEHGAIEEECVPGFGPPRRRRNGIPRLRLPVQDGRGARASRWLTSRRSTFPSAVLCSSRNGRR